MSVFAERLRERYFRHEHPYHTFEHAVESCLTPNCTLLGAGCGRTAPVLSRYRDRARRLIGVDLVAFDASVSDLGLLYRADLGAIPVGSSSAHIAMARSVMEHVTDHARVYADVFRVLKPGGVLVFLTVNLLDYASMIAKLTPQRLHAWIVSETEGREERDVFPIAYRTNTRRAVTRWGA